MTEVHIVVAPEGYEIVGKRAPGDDAWTWPDGVPQLGAWTPLEVFVYDRPVWELPVDLDLWRGEPDDAAWDDLDLWLPADCTLIGTGTLVCRDNAADAVRDALEAYGEFLPLWEPLRSERWWLFNPLVVADVLDEEQSDLYRGHHSGRIMGIRRWVFHEDRLAGLGAFLIPQSGHLCLTGEPLRKVQAAGLSGLEVHRVWRSTGAST